MKKLFVILALVCANGCFVVGKNTAKEYAERAHPECSDFIVLSHSYGSGKNGESLTEVNMKCGENKTRSITIKCRYGMGIISDTVCHENN